MTKVWFTASELAALNLPGLPVGRTNLLRSIAAQKWNQRHDKTGAPLARKRVGRGGGFEYHLDLLPQSARAVLEPSQSLVKADLEPQFSPTWAWYEVQSTKIKQEAEKRLAAVNEFEQLAKNSTRSVAVRLAARRHELSVATLWNYLGLIEGCRRADRLPNLAPRRKGGGVKCEIHPEIWQFFKSDYLRASNPTFSACYERAKELADCMNLSLPHLKTFQRRLLKEVPKLVLIRERQGDKAILQTIPHQTRTVSDLHPLHTIVLDGHTWDVFTATEGKTDKKNSKSWRRLTALAIQDLYSRKILAVRIGYSETIELTRLALYDVFQKYGIPQQALMDNGRSFASPEISGGAEFRFRNHVNEEEQRGLLSSLGIQSRFTTVAHGQAKPIERAFRDLCERIAKHPFCEGAYTGPAPHKKPHKYGQRAILESEFIAFALGEIAKHNAKIGRRTEIANGRSFDEAFNAEFGRVPIGKASPEQMRMALLVSKVLRARRMSGEVEIEGNRYQSPIMVEHAGERIQVRFDPDNLHGEVFAYKLTGEFIAALPCIDATGFFDRAGSKQYGSAQKALKKAVRNLVEAEQLLSSRELAKRLRSVEAEIEPPPSPKIIKPIGIPRGRASAALAQKIIPNSVSKSDADALLSRFDAAMERRQNERDREDNAIFKIIQGGLSAENPAQFGQ